MRGRGRPQGGRGFALFRQKSGALIINEPAAKGPAAARHGPGKLRVCAGLRSAGRGERSTEEAASTAAGMALARGPSLQPHAPATKPSGFPRFQKHTNRSKYRALPGNAPAPQGRGCHKKFALSESQLVISQSVSQSRGNPSGSPVEPGPERAGPSRAVGQPGSARGGRSRAGRAAAPQTAPRHPRLLLEGGIR